MVVVVADLGVEEMEEATVEAAEVGIKATVVVEVEVGAISGAVAVAAADMAEEAISEGVVETSEVEEAVNEASTVAEVEGVVGAGVLENREGTWLLFSLFHPVSSELQRIRRKHTGNFGCSCHGQISR